PVLIQVRVLPRLLLGIIVVLREALSVGLLLPCPALLLVVVADRPLILRAGVVEVSPGRAPAAFPALIDGVTCLVEASVLAAVAFAAARDVRRLGRVMTPGRHDDLVLVLMIRPRHRVPRGARGPAAGVHAFQVGAVVGDGAPAGHHLRPLVFQR